MCVHVLAGKSNTKCVCLYAASGACVCFRAWAPYWLDIIAYQHLIFLLLLLEAVCVFGSLRCGDAVRSGGTFFENSIQWLFLLFFFFVFACVCIELGNRYGRKSLMCALCAFECEACEEHSLNIPFGRRNKLGNCYGKYLFRKYRLC